MYNTPLYINLATQYAVAMTLAFRNRTIIAHITVSLFVIAALITFITFMLLEGKFDRITQGIRLLPVLHYSKFTVPVSILALVVYVAAAGFALFFMFEKTQSSEVIYFAVFLFSCLCEGFRFVILFFNTVNFSLDFSIFAARSVFLGRICSALTFLAASVFCSDKLEHDPERICYLIFAAAAVVSILTPFNTSHVTSNAMLTYGYANQILLIRILFAVITFFCFFISGVTGEIPEFKRVAWGFVLLYIGYFLLTVADNVFSCFAGIFLLPFGTKIFLSNLHRYYLWK